MFTCTPYSGWIGTQVAVDFRFQHGMISEQLYAQINEACKGQWGKYEAPTEPCKSLLEDPVRPCLSHAGDTYDMGGGYYLYDTCGNDLLALGPDNFPIQDMEKAQADIASTVKMSLSSSTCERALPCCIFKFLCLEPTTNLLQTFNDAEGQTAIRWCADAGRLY